MGVRLVRYNRSISGNTNNNASQNFEHDKLVNRDMLDQHPIRSITNLQETLSLFEDSINDLSLLINEKTSNTDIESLVNEVWKDIDNDINYSWFNGNQKENKI